MKSAADTIEGYLASLPEERRTAIAAVREAILANLDGDYAEGMQYGMIGYCVPKSVYPAGYHVDPKQPLPFAALASQKQHMALYLFGLYVSGEESDDAAWFRTAWEASGKKLDMGKSCVRFKRLADVPLDVVGAAIARLPAATFVARYEAARAQTEATKKARSPVAKKKPAPRGGSRG